MENVSIAIVSNDKAYNRALSMSLLNSCRNFAIKIFDCREFISAWSAHKGREAYYELYDIVLWAGSEVSDAYGDNIVYLVEKASMIKKDFKARKFCLYKYSNSQIMVAGIFEIYAFLTGRKAVCMHDSDVRIIAFASCAGGTGCTCLAASVAQELIRFRGMRVMYISLEEIESTGEFTRHMPGARNAGEYLYRLFKTELTGEDNIPFLDSYIVKDVFGIEAFSPTKGRNPLISLSESEMQSFLAAIADSGRYDSLIIDAGSSLSDACIAALQLAEKICFVTRSGDGRYREEQYLSHLICTAGEIMLEKMLRVANMASAGEGEDYSAGDDPSGLAGSSGLVKNGLPGSSKVSGIAGSTKKNSSDNPAKRRSYSGGYAAGFNATAGSDDRSALTKGNAPVPPVKVKWRESGTMSGAASVKSPAMFISRQNEYEVRMQQGISIAGSGENEALEGAFGEDICRLAEGLLKKV